MKKLICLLTVLCLLASLAGCRGPSNQETQDTGGTSTDPTDGPTDPITFVPEQEPMAAVAVPTVTESSTAADGTVIFTYTHQNMMLTLPDPDVADKVIIDFLGRVDSTRNTADSMLSAAQAAYDGSAYWTPYLCNITYSPTRIDQGVLSLFGSSISFSGTAHPDRNCVSANYDLVTGDVLTLGSIMSATATKDDFIRLVLEALAQIEDENYLYGGYDETVRQRFTKDESKDEDWYFSNTGLCFYFAPYEIAPYSSGVIVAEIPYEKLAGLLYDGYFPAERDVVDSTVQASRFAQTNAEAFTQIAEVVLDANGEMVFLYTDGLVWDVQIEVGTWDITGTEFTVAYTALFSHALSPGDAIMVQTMFPDVLPILRLTYQAGTETVTKFISQSGKDGSILLTDA